MGYQGRSHCLELPTVTVRKVGTDKGVVFPGVGPNEQRCKNLDQTTKARRVYPETKLPWLKNGKKK